MDSNTTLNLGQGSDSGRLGVAPQQPNRKDDEITPVKSHVTLVGDSGIEHMTLNTVALRTPIGVAKDVPQHGFPKPVATSPWSTKPENYVVAPEKLGESPDFVDCPWCQERRKTRVVHTDSSQTT